MQWGDSRQTYKIEEFHTQVSLGPSLQPRSRFSLPVGRREGRYKPLYSQQRNMRIVNSLEKGIHIPQLQSTCCKRYSNHVMQCAFEPKLFKLFVLALQGFLETDLGSISNHVGALWFLSYTGASRALLHVPHRNSLLLSTAELPMLMILKMNTLIRDCYRWYDALLASTESAAANPRASVWRNYRWVLVVELS